MSDEVLIPLASMAELDRALKDIVIEFEDAGSRTDSLLDASYCRAATGSCASWRWPLGRTMIARTTRWRGWRRRSCDSFMAASLPRRERAGGRVTDGPRVVCRSAVCPA